MDIEKDKLNYDLKVQQLFANVNAAGTIDEKVKLFEDFTTKFTTIPRIWREWARIVNENQPTEKQNENKKSLWIKSMSHFYSKVFVDDLFQMDTVDFKKELIWSKLIQRQVEWERKSIKPLLSYLNYVQKSLSLPNDKLQSFLEYLEEFSTKPIPPKIYEEYLKSKELLPEIFAHFPYQKEWILTMKKVGDDKFVIQNLEREITMNFADKRLWKVYIEFLKEKCHLKWLLNVYSRYCRLFIDDLEMKKEYQNELSNTQKMKYNFDVSKWKIDLIKIENDFGPKESASNLMKEYFGKVVLTKEDLDLELKLMETKEKEDSKIPDYAIDENQFSLSRCSKYIRFQLNAKEQTFALPSKLISAILEKANLQILQKLYSSSKQLYSITEIPICHRLDLTESITTVTFEKSLFISTRDIQIGKTAKQLHLTNSLFINSENKNRKLLTEFMPKIYKCHIRFLSLRYLDIEIGDFDFLVQNVKKFECLDTVIKLKEGKALSITEIIDRMPNVSYITFITDGTAVFENSVKNFSEKEKGTKIDYLHIRVIREVRDPSSICSFIWKNASPKSRFYIELKTTQNYVDRLEDLIKAKLNAWIPKDEKPTVIIRKEISIPTPRRH